MATEGLGLVELVIAHLKKVASTDLARNWFAWQAVAGHYNHDLEDAVPPYLRRDRHERSLGARTETHFHHRNIFDVLAEAGAKTWTHYTVCDAPDWMPAPVQRKLFDEVFRTSKDGAILQTRSVETEDLVARHGLQKRFRRVAKASTEATAHDRSRLYRRVDYYEVCH